MVASVLLPFLLAAVVVAQDPCTVLAGKKWAAPAEVRACYQSFAVDEAEKSNILEVMNKTINFHTSTNYQIRAPQPYADQVHENLYTDIARIGASSYASDYEMHIDMSRTYKRLQDGHCVWINYCYDSAWINYLPTPLSLITDNYGKQSVHIAYEAFKVASAVNGTLEGLSGAKVLSIDGKDPQVAIDANAKITGSYQAWGTRQNSFFASYQRAASTWNYILGNFAQQSLPLADSVTLKIVRVNATKPETVTLPYRSRIGAIASFTDGPSYRAANCKADEGTNGVDVYATSGDTVTDPTFKAQGIPLPKERPHKQLVNILLDDTPATDVVLPPTLAPANPIAGGFEVAQFYMLDDGKTGVFALGSFSASDYLPFLQSMLDGLTKLKEQGATQLVVDVSNNGGGYICAAHWLHRIIAGSKPSTVPQAGLDTIARSGTLAKLITEQIVKNNKDPSHFLLYNPVNWHNATQQIIPADVNWLVVGGVNKTINGHKDAFSQRLGEECTDADYPAGAPEAGLFDPKKVVIVTNGRCASSCSLFSITMHKLEGSKTVVLGGKADVQQEFCGVVGGQSTDFSTMDTEIKSTGLKDHELAPPDLVVNGVHGITWRLGYGIEKKNEPEEWQEHRADGNLAITPELANNPTAIWKTVAKKYLH
ncbi:hypothetical protein DL96DRAFT_1805805 [Flagelloscypha sp. PMI_526]|nr:hypothetical protein DL96DRAFT_1805805 [Flagelloscypha sp. PMI_526]